MDLLELGKAAEHFVCCDLISRGYRVQLASQGSTYDILLDLGKRQFRRVQCKATQEPKEMVFRNGFGKEDSVRPPRYCWTIRRRGKGEERLYTADDFDIVACFALDVEKIAYLPIQEMPQTLCIVPPGAPDEGNRFEDYSLKHALANCKGAVERKIRNMPVVDEAGVVYKSGLEADRKHGLPRGTANYEATRGKGRFKFLAVLNKDQFVTSFDS